jgi:hypothetical protein
MEPEEVIADVLGSLALVLILLFLGAVMGGLAVGAWMAHRPHVASCPEGAR